MIVCIQDPLYSVMALMLLGISPIEEGEKDLFQNRISLRAPCDGTEATGTTWTHGKFQLDTRKKRSTARVVRP